MDPDKLRDARRTLGLSQAGLAEALRLGRHGGRTVRRWELGERDIPGAFEVALALMLAQDAPDRPTATPLGKVR